MICRYILHDKIQRLELVRLTQASGLRHALVTADTQKGILMTTSLLETTLCLAYASECRMICPTSQ